MNSRRSFLKGILAAGVAPCLGGCLSRRGEAVSFAMFNDVHEHLDYFAKLAAHGGDACDFAVFAGDILNDVRADGSVKRLLVEPMAGVSRRFGAPVHFVRGNHETRGPEAGGLWRSLGYSEPVYYSAKTLGGVRFVFLDTCESRPNEQLAREGRANFDEYLGAEKAWLEREIASRAWREAHARIAFMHIPPPVRNVDRTSSDRVPVLRSTRVKAVLALQDVLLSAGTTAVFAGHIHMGSFDMPTDERPYPVIVGGGSRVDPVYPTEPLLTRCNIVRGEFVVRQISLDGSIRHERRFTI